MAVDSRGGRVDTAEDRSRTETLVPRSPYVILKVHEPSQVTESVSALSAAVWARETESSGRGSRPDRESPRCRPRVVDHSLADQTSFESALRCCARGDRTDGGLESAAGSQRDVLARFNKFHGPIVSAIKAVSETAIVLNRCQLSCIGPPRGARGWRGSRAKVPALKTAKFGQAACQTSADSIDRGTDTPPTGPKIRSADIKELQA
jgi:hypothetical protein